MCLDRGPNLIYVTMDGVRSHEFFKGTGLLHRGQVPKSERGQLFTHLFNEQVPQGILYGRRGPVGQYRIESSIAISLPSYQAMFVGHDNDCKSNGCSQVSEETVFERIKTELKLKKEEVAVIASWNGIAKAVEHKVGTLLVSAGPVGVIDETVDPVLDALNQKAVTDLPPWGGAKKDLYTAELALHYLKKHCPRVLYISFDDSDERGHRGEYLEYIRSMRFYDGFMKKLFETLHDQDEYGKNTTIFLSTDHSRGSGPFWKDHAVTSFTEKNIFLFVKGPYVKPQGRVGDLKCRGHRYLRPTFEKLMGLSPTPYPKNRKVYLLDEVLP